MKIRHGIVLILLLGLVAGAAGAGDAIPVLPHEFYGGVMIAGSPAPAGTVITATIGGTEYGSIQTVNAGQYGSPDESLANRLIIAATEDQIGETITFLVNGVAAQETSVFTSEAVTALDLSVAGASTPTITPTPTSTPGGGGGGGNNGGGGPSKDPGSELTYDPDAPAAPEIFTARASLVTSTAGVVLEQVTVRTENEIGAVTIPEGTTARDRDGNPLGEVTCAEVAQAEVPPAPPGTTVAIALACGPAGATFDPPAVLTYTLSEEEWAGIGEGAVLSVMWYNPETGGWQEIDATVDPATRTITAQVSHFSIYALAWTVPETVAAGAEGTMTPASEPGATEPGTLFPTWVLALVVVLIVAVAASLIMRRK